MFLCILNEQLHAHIPHKKTEHNKTCLNLPISLFLAFLSSQMWFGQADIGQIINGHFKAAT